MKDELIPTVRGATTDDLKRLTEVDHLWDAEPGRRRLIKSALNDQRCLVAESEGVVVGFACYSRSFFDNAFIDLIVIARDSRRQGFGKALIGEIERLSPTPSLFTSTNRSNRTARRFLAACGFVESGYVENLDENDPEIVYFKPLS